MAYTAAELSGPLLYGDDKKRFFYDASDVPDAIATVNTSGYFNNSDDNIRMEVDDLITVKTTEGLFDLVVTASTGGAVTTALYRGGDESIQTVSGTSQTLRAFGVSVITQAATGGTYIYSLPAPDRVGQRKVIIATTATDHQILSTGSYTFGTTGQSSLTLTATAGAQNHTSVELLAVASTQYLIMASQVATTGTLMGSTG